MTTYVALLRGINVGKAKRVAMADLRAVAERLGHADVRTLLNSGNLVFRARTASAAALEQAIARELGVTSRIALLTSDEFEQVARANTLVAQAKDPTRLFVTVLTDNAGRTRLADVAAKAWRPEAFALGARAAYLWCPGGQIESPLAKAVAKALGDGATTRNWSTIEKLRALCSNPEA